MFCVSCYAALAASEEISGKCLNGELFLITASIRGLLNIWTSCGSLPKYSPRRTNRAWNGEDRFKISVTGLKLRGKSFNWTASWVTAWLMEGQRRDLTQDINALSQGMWIGNASKRYQLVGFWVLIKLNANNKTFLRSGWNVSPNKESLG